MTEANTGQLNFKFNQGQCYIYTLSSSIIGLEAAVTLIQKNFVLYYCDQIQSTIKCLG